VQVKFTPSRYYDRSDYDKWDPDYERLNKILSNAAPLPHSLIIDEDEGCAKDLDVVNLFKRATPFYRLGKFGHLKRLAVLPAALVEVHPESASIYAAALPPSLHIIKFLGHTDSADLWATHMQKRLKQGRFPHLAKIVLRGATSISEQAWNRDNAESAWSELREIGIRIEASQYEARPARIVLERRNTRNCILSRKTLVAMLTRELSGCCSFES